MIEKNNWQEEVNHLKSLIEKTNLVRTTKWGTDVYTYNNKNVVSTAGFKNHFTIWFYNGVFLKDPYNVLTAASEGKTKSLRQWRFTSVSQIDDAKITAYINEAIANEELGLKISPAKFEPIPTPSILETAFNVNHALKIAFKALTPGRQKEYILFLNEAKQDATKLRRLEKIEPLILNGVGLHDKYK